MQLILNPSSVFLESSEQVHRAAAQCQGLTCGTEGLQVVMVAILLASAIVSIIVALNFFREDKEEQITPLCPQLAVDSETPFSLVLHRQTETTEVTGLRHRCRAVIDYPDPFRPGSSGVTATVRLVSDWDLLATVVVRSVSMQGQGLALCRGGNDIFGFVEPEAHTKRYHVRHRTGVHMMTLAGDFEKMSIGFFNPARVQVGSIKMSGEECSGHVLQQVDAGLVLASFLGAYIHQQLTRYPAPVRSPTPPEGPGGSASSPASAAEAEAKESPAPAPRAASESAVPVFGRPLLDEDPEPEPATGEL